MNENSDISKLIDTIKRHSIENEDEWYRDLESRKKEEIDLHNKLRDMQFRKHASQQEIKKYFSNTKMLDGYSQNEESLLTNNQLYFEEDYLLKNSISGLSDQYFNNLIKSVAKGSVILDLACGFGRESIIAAKNSAKFVVGIDLSPLSVKEANSLAEKNNLNNAIFAVGDCEKLYFEDNTFDYVICARMLHHVKFEKVIREVYRVLKSGGEAICIEALGINPVINYYRQITPAQRTHWEKSNILTHRHIKIARKYFNVKNIKYWHILSPLAKFSRIMLPVFNFIDRILLTKIPYFNRLSWTFTFHLKKNL